MYMLPDGESAFPRTAAAVVAMQSGGVYRSKEVEAAFGYLEEHGLGISSREESPSDGLAASGYYYYGQYYAALALWQRGGNLGQVAYSQLVARLMEQRREGRWNSPYSQEYATAMACIVLQLPYHYLPIAQR
jgi:hypothetical protein